MGTVQERTDTFQWADSTGAVWDVEITWNEVAGRAEVTRLVLDSHGGRAVTSAVMRQAEAMLKERHAREVEQLQRLVKNGTEQVRRRAERQLAAWQKARRGPGSRRDDDVWLERVLVMWEAKRERRSMREALRTTYDVSMDTAHTWAKRAAKWDRETGLNLLAAQDPNNPRVVGRGVQAALALGKAQQQQTKGSKR